MLRHRGDLGSATVLVLALAAVLALVGATTACLAAVAVARHRAGSAADLAALAAADRAREGQPIACAAAARVAEAAAARLERCVLTGDIVDVSVAVHPPGAIGSWGVARSDSRAGPSRR